MKASCLFLSIRLGIVFIHTDILCKSLFKDVLEAFCCHMFFNDFPANAVGNEIIVANHWFDDVILNHLIPAGLL